MYSRYEWKDLSETLSHAKVEIVENKIFGNNLSIVFDENQTPPQDLSKQLEEPCRPINCIIFLAVYVYNVSNAIVQLALAIKSICGNILDVIIQRYISIHIVRSFTPSKVSNLIDLLESMYKGILLIKCIAMI